MPWVFSALSHTVCFSYWDKELNLQEQRTAGAAAGRRGSRSDNGADSPLSGREAASRGAGPAQTPWEELPCAGPFLFLSQRLERKMLYFPSAAPFEFGNVGAEALKMAGTGGLASSSDKWDIQTPRAIDRVEGW